MKRVMADAASIEEVEAALRGGDDWGAIATAVIRVGHQGVGPMLGQVGQSDRLKHNQAQSGTEALRAVDWGHCDQLSSDD